MLTTLCLRDDDIKAEDLSISCSPCWIVAWEFHDQDHEASNSSLIAEWIIQSALLVLCSIVLVLTFIVFQLGGGE